MEKHRILDAAGGRKIHSGYTAHMGGVVIFIGFLCGFCFSLTGIREEISPLYIVSLLVLLGFVMVIGINDDMNSLSPVRKLIFEIVVSLCLCALGIRLKSFGGFLGIHTLPVWISYGLTTFFFIVVSNAYNLIDGIDGQAALQALAALGGIAFFLWQFIPVEMRIVEGLNNPMLWLMLIASAMGGIVGFLLYNWQKARIFMGDTGSIFIGFIIGMAIIVCMNLNVEGDAQVWNYKIQSNLGVILCAFFLPLADTLRVFILRVRKGKSPLYPDKTHIHHLLLRINGFSHAKCALTLFFLQVGIMLVMFFLSLFFNDNIFAIIIFFAWVLYVAFVQIIARIKLKHITK
jgi:UDP-N-acetylmuramyl pentapeptide phosphotransferase/UDP-N-acetylglucosamine-1-phosphate transferase